MIFRKPILVTGSHRSGSTWAGQMIALSSEVKYIYEPFNIGTEDHKPLVNWFEYVNAETDKKHADRVAKYLGDKLGLTLTGLRRNLNDVKSVKDTRNLLWKIKNNSSRRPLMKDPIAVMSADWLHRTFKMDVIVMIRHPAAFVASLKLKDWQFDFNHFSGQPALMDIIPPDYAKKVKAYARAQPGIIDQGILLWNIIHYRISQYKKQFPSWMFVKHEDLSEDPIEEFRKIFNHLGLPFSGDIKAGIEKSTNPEKESSFKRNSKSNIFSWKKRLEPHETACIRKDTEKIAAEFYDSNHW